MTQRINHNLQRSSANRGERRPFTVFASQVAGASASGEADPKESLYQFDGRQAEAQKVPFTLQITEMTKF